MLAEYGRRIQRRAALVECNLNPTCKQKHEPSLDACGRPAQAASRHSFTRRRGRVVARRPADDEGAGAVELHLGTISDAQRC